MNSGGPPGTVPPWFARGTLAILVVLATVCRCMRSRGRLRPRPVRDRQVVLDSHNPPTVAASTSLTTSAAMPTGVRTQHGVEVLPPLLQAIAAFAAAVFLAFAFRQPNVSPVLVILGLSLAGATVVGASLWAWRARIGIAQPLIQPGAPWQAFGMRWKAIAVVDTCLLLGLVSVVLVQGLRAVPDYTSAYDGQDPALSDCRQSARPVSGNSSPVADTSGQVIGEVRLVASYACTTLFVEITYPDPTLKPRDEVAVITMLRPGDKARAVFKSVLSTDSEVSWGNMLSNNSACVEAEVVVVKIADNSVRGPELHTDCVLA